MPFPKVKQLFLPIFLVTGFGMFFASGANDLVTWQALSQHYNSIKNFVSEHRALSYFGFFFVYTVAVSFSLPIASLLTLAGGAILEWPAAVALVVGAATVGAGLVFLAAQNLFANILRRQMGTFFSDLEEGFAKNAFLYLLALRLFPVAPFWVVNIVPALTKMPLHQFLAATFIGIIPGTLVYAWIGLSFDHVLAAGKTPDLKVLTSLNILLPLAGLGLFALMPIILRHWQVQALKSKIEKKTRPEKTTKE